jgi:glutamate racemase
VIACGTASSQALETVSAEVTTPLFGVVYPACAAALAATKTGRIGVIGTEGTIRSGAYPKQLTAMREGLTILTRSCPLFVPMVENGRVHPGDVVIETLAREYLTDLKEAGVDVLILGCTHYPLLRSVIAAVMGDGVTLVDAGAAVADSLREQIAPSNTGAGSVEYFVSDTPESFERLASLFLGEPEKLEAELIDIGRY